MTTLASATAGNLLKLAIVVSGLAFLSYGVLCVSGYSLVQDFHRFGIEWLRIPTGYLEILGGAGLLVGLSWLPALRLSALGLCLLMLVGFGFRLKFRDSVEESLPSFGFMLLNLYILIQSFRV